MKIIKLRLKNLNSLYGEWEIDFTDDQIQDSGLFAISGPTGGGKSTILDAICLALYGETPRLDSINTSSNELMSRHTGECHSELEYEIGGVRYLSKWYQKRSRGKADQKLQPVKREISRWNESDQKYDPQAEKIKAIDTKVAEITGMDFQRFTRTILLAQGNFAAFLKANDESRSKLLEQITGTDIYSKISLKVHERHREEEGKLKEISLRMDGVQLLNEEELKSLTDEQQTLSSEVAKLNVQRTKVTEKISWLKGISNLEAKQAENKLLLIAHEKHVQAFSNQQIILDTGKRASKVNQHYRLLSDSRSALETLINKKKSLGQQLIEQKSLLSHGQKITAKTESNYLAKEKFISKQRPVWIKVRAMDTRLEALQSQINADKVKLEGSLKSYNSGKKQGKELITKKQQLEAELKTTKDYLESHPEDQLAATRADVIHKQVNQWQQTHEQVINQHEKLKLLNERIDNGKNHIIKQQELLNASNLAVTDLTKKIDKYQTELINLLDGKLTREFETELKHLTETKELEANIQSLKEHRHQLEPGKECPLCGSEEHPFTDGNKRESKVTIIEASIVKIESKIKAISEAEKNSDYLKNEKVNAELVAKNQREKLKNYTEALSVLEGDLKTLTLESDKLQKYLAETEQELKVSFSGLTEDVVFESERLKHLSVSISQRGVNWNKSIKKAEPIQTALHKLETDINTNLERIKGLKTNYDDQQTEVKANQDIWKELLSERQQIFANDVVDTVETGLLSELKLLENNFTTAKAEQNSAEKLLAQKQQSLTDTEQQLEEIQPKLKSDEKLFDKSLIENKFVDESSFKAAVISEDQLNTLVAESKSIQTNGDSLNTLSSSILKDLTIEKEKDLTTEKLDNLTKTYEEIDKHLTANNERVGEVRKGILTHNENLDMQAKDVLKHQAQQQSLKVWKQLHELIGSGDGKKFRNYAQGLTFEWVVKLANTKLQTISDRYLLIRDKENPLQLNVLDNYQGGEERSTKNLSGGESFLISLALALGLSQMVSDNIQMDSLFLDEGFGTLDEESMEIVVDALSALRQDGKLIGVISHVQELKERLTTQIRVIPSNGGKSHLSGAGVIKKTTSPASIE